MTGRISAGDFITPVAFPKYNKIWRKINLHVCGFCEQEDRCNITDRKFPGIGQAPKIAKTSHTRNIIVVR